MFLISVVNRTRTISDRELHRVTRAINRQIAEDFEPYWAFGGQLRVEGPAGMGRDLSRLLELRGDAVLYLMENARDRDALGYHETNMRGIPYGVVYLDLCKELGDEWSTTLSHEALELIGDPSCNLLVQGPHPSIPDRTVYHYFEMCDAVQSQNYEIDGVTVSNFVLPQYFTEGEQLGARNDFCGTALVSYSVNPGGYIGFFDPIVGADQRFFNRNDPVALERMQLKGDVSGGRVMRRMQASAHRMADAAAAAAATGPADPIKHVVVLMLENRSFDHMLGALREVKPDLDGVDPARPGQNVDTKTGAQIAQAAVAKNFVSRDFKVPHEYADVVRQIEPAMGGFVDAYRAENPAATDDELQQVMAYFKRGDLPALHTLAENFLVCDRWFSSLPGPTWPNRLFVHSGTSLGDVIMPSASDLSSFRLLFGHYNQDTLYDRLSQANLKWRIYADGPPQSLILTHQIKSLVTNYRPMDAFFAATQGSEENFPAYAFIEPRYYDNASGGANDQHPPSGALPGDQLIAAVYNAIRGNEALWRSTLLVITYDEHGGFYDHVTPPHTVAPDDNAAHFTPEKGVPDFDFTRLGVRVPTVLVSPWVRNGVDHTTYDHTSILRYVCEKWGMTPLCRRAAAGAGNNAIASFAPALTLAEPRTDTPQAIASPAAGVRAAAVPADLPMDNTQEALVAYTELLQESTSRGAALPPGARRGTVHERARAADRWWTDTVRRQKDAAPQPEPGRRRPPGRPRVVPKAINGEGVPEHPPTAGAVVTTVPQPDTGAEPSVQ